MAGQYSDSEFDGSELDDMEMNLYQQLYFNDKYSELNNGKRNIVHKPVSEDKLCNNENLTVGQNCNINLNLENIDKSVDYIGSPSTEKICEIVNPSSISSEQDCENYLSKVDNEKLDLIDDAYINKSVNSESCRIRTESICSSVESISGKIPLDNLYLNNTFEDEIFFSGSDNELSGKSKPLPKAKKRRKIIREEESKCSSLLNLKKKNKLPVIRKIIREEESKCSSLLNLKKKNKLPVITENSGSESDEITIISPIPEKPKDITVVDEDIENYSSDSICILEYKNLRDRPAKRRKKNIKTNKASDSYTAKSVKIDSERCIEKQLPNSNRIASESDSSSDEYSLETGPDNVANLSNLIFNTKNIESEKTRYNSFKLKSSSASAKKGSSAIFSKGCALTTRKPGCKKWTQEMATLYDSDEPGELSVKEIHSTQSDSPLLWKVDYEDLCPKSRPRYFNKITRCTRCREEGHLVRNCPKKQHCLYCGSTDHSYYKLCPDQCCLKCGEVHGRFCEKTHIRVTCFRCGLKGHDVSLCPDSWRRFHVTTSGSIAIPSNIVDTRPDKYCYNCGRKGHFGSECGARASYLPVPKTIFSYEDLDIYAYNDPEQFEAKSSSQSAEASSICMMLTRRNFILLKDNIEAIRNIENKTRVKLDVHTIKSVCKICIKGDLKNCREAQNLINFFFDRGSLSATPDKSNRFIDRKDHVICSNENSQKIDWNHDFLGLNIYQDGMSTANNEDDSYSNYAKVKSPLNDKSPKRSTRFDDRLEMFDENWNDMSFDAKSDNKPEEFASGLHGRFNRYVEEEFDKFPKTSQKIKQYVSKCLKRHPPNRFINVFKACYKELKDCIAGVYQSGSVGKSVPSNTVIIDKYCKAGSLLSVHLLNKYHYRQHFDKFKKLVIEMRKSKTKGFSMYKKRQIGNYFFNIYIPELSELNNVLRYGEWVLANKEKVKSYFRSKKSDGSYDSKTIKKMKFFNLANKDYFKKMKPLGLKKKKKKSKSKKKNDLEIFQ